MAFAGHSLCAIRGKRRNTLFGARISLFERFNSLFATKKFPVFIGQGIFLQVIEVPAFLAAKNRPSARLPEIPASGAPILAAGPLIHIKAR